MEGIDRVNLGNHNYATGLGYITIPIGVDRERYIQTCYRKERVAIQLDGGGSVINNCYISRSVLQEIAFPEKINQLGSCVSFICLKHHNLPIIIATISKPDETQLLEENSFKKTVKTKKANINIEGKGKSGELFINVESTLENEGSIYITLKSKNDTSKFELKCFGDIDLYSEGKTSLKALKNVNLQKIKIEGQEEIVSSEIILSDEGFEIRDSFNNAIHSSSDGSLNIVPASVCNLFEGGEALLLGTTTKRELLKFKERFDTFLKTFSDTVAVPSDGGKAIQVAVKLAMASLNEEDFENIDSKKAFTD
jgi:hypothetical protein